MNILITSCRGLGYGGAEISIMQFAQELQKRGHNVIIASPEKYPELKTELFKFVEKYPYQIQHVYLKNFFKKIIQKYSIQIVTSQDRVTTIPAIQAAKDLSIPIVVQFRDYWFACPKSTCLKPDNSECKYCDWSSLRSCSYGKRFFIDLYKSQYLKKYWSIIDTADLKLVASTSLKNKLANCGILNNVQLILHPRKLDEFENVENVQEFKNQFKLRKIVVGFIGVAFTQSKGVLQPFDYLPEILRTHKDVSFLMVGDGPLVSQIKEIITKEHIEDQVVLTGRVPFAKIPTCYAACDIVLIPHLWEEPFGAILLEAAASGKATITSEKGGPADVRDDFGYVISPYDTNLWKEKLLFLIENASERERIGKLSKENIKKHSIELYVDVLEKHYNELLFPCSKNIVSK
jgi:glycosyltransferase involved in cell wall biosynthesis